MKKKISWIQIAAGFVAVLLILASLFISWANKPYLPSEAALQALESDEQTTVVENSGLYVFEPAGGNAKTGFIFYPGGLVDYRAYAAPLHEIASQGYFVALVPMPLNLAVFNSDAAAQVIALYPDIERWVVGGHSLGGSMSAFYAAKDERVAGLVFWASYPGDESLLNSEIKILSIYGSQDMAGMDKFEETKALLPATTTYVIIEGGNHAQFGDYGEQAGDLVATISREDQQTQAVSATVEFLNGFEK